MNLEQARRPVRWRRRPVQLLAAAAAVAIGVSTYVATSSSATAQIHVRGTLRLGPTAAADMIHPVGAVENGDVCQSGAGYDDITAGAAVTVGGSNGQPLAVGPLSGGAEAGVDDSAGMALGFCVFSFDVGVPDGQSAYTVTISHRGTQTFTPEQVAAGIALTLGN